MRKPDPVEVLDDMTAEQHLSGLGMHPAPVLPLRRPPPLWAVVGAIAFDLALDFALFYSIGRRGSGR
jgi:hypothetical protein